MSEKLKTIADTLGSVRTIISFAGTMMAFVAIGTLGWVSLSSKPTRAEVDVLIAASSSTVHSQIHDIRKELNASALSRSRIIEKLNRSGRMAELLLAQLEWQTKALQRIGGTRLTEPPDVERLRRSLLLGESTP